MDINIAYTQFNLHNTTIASLHNYNNFRIKDNILFYFIVLFTEISLHKNKINTPIASYWHTLGQYTLG